MNARVVCAVLAALMFVGAPGQARAQGASDSPWSVDVAIGWDNSISGDFLTGAVGTLQGAPLVINKQTWDEIYGTGTLFNVAVGYDFDERSELRAGFTYQSTGADESLPIGTLRGAPLNARFDNYKAWGLDFGYRRYFTEVAERWRPYAGGTVGFGGVSAIEASLASGTAFVLTDTDFYDGNGALTFSGNGGVLYRLTDRVSLDARLGLRYVSGLSDVEGGTFTGLDDVNEGSSRWTLPITVGAKFRF